MRDKVLLEGWLISLEKVMLKHPDWKEVDPTYLQQLIQSEGTKIIELFPSLGTRPKVPFSFSCGYIDRIVTVQEFIENIVKGAEEILEKKSSTMGTIKKSHNAADFNGKST